MMVKVQAPTLTPTTLDIRTHFVSPYKLTTGLAVDSSSPPRLIEDGRGRGRGTVTIAVTVSSIEGGNRA